MLNSLDIANRKREECLRLVSAQEQEFNAWVKSLEELPESVKSTIPMSKLVYRELMPEYFADKPDIDKKHSDWVRFNKIVGLINNRIEDYYKQAETVIKQIDDLNKESL